jgi:hypothetical protein
MDYRNDIFLSYKRNSETLRWIQDHFLPLLTLRVGFELGRDPDVYVDTQVHAGTSWPLELGAQLGYSRILVPLWTRTYFSSEWCALEMSHMLAREKEMGFRTPQNRQSLIVPAIVHNGNPSPPELRDIEYFELQDCFNVRMNVNSPRAEELDATLMKYAPALARAIGSAPSWQEQWSKQAAEEFYTQLHEGDEPSQDSLPRFTTR